MPDSSSNLTIDDREQLVAYLDGELPSAECADVENRLSADAAFRVEMQRLAKAWDVLDELPRETAGDHFANTTIEMVAVAAEEEIAAVTAGVSSRRVKKSLVVAGLLAIATVAGFVTARQLWPDANEQLIADLPIIEHLDALSQFREVDFLRSLKDEFGGRVDVLGPMELDSARNDMIATSKETRSERRQRVRALSPDAMQRLSAHFAQFGELDTTTQRRLRRMQREIAAAEDRDSLIGAMIQYNAWLADRTAGERAALRELSAEARIEEIRQMLARDQRHTMRRLPEKDRDALRRVVTQYIHDHWGELAQTAQPRESAQWKRRLERSRNPEMMRLMVGARLLRHPKNKRHGPKLLKLATAALSTESQQFLRGVRTDQRKSDVMLHWIQQSIHPPEVTSKQLEEFFAGDDLSNDERERLLAMPLEPMRDELRRRYSLSKWGIAWDERWEWRGLRDHRPNDGPPGRGQGGQGRGRGRGGPGRFDVPGGPSNGPNGPNGPRRRGDPPRRRGD